MWSNCEEILSMDFENFKEIEDGVLFKVFAKFYVPTVYRKTSWYFPKVFQIFPQNLLVES